MSKRCRCCGERFSTELVETVCSVCADECTNEGCVVANWVPVPADVSEVTNGE